MTSGLHSGHSAFLLFLMRRLFHIFLILSSSLCSILENKTSCIPYDGFNSGQTEFNLQKKSLEKWIHQALFCLFKIEHHYSIRWLYLELPNKKPECPDIVSWCSPLKYHCIPATATFSLPLWPLIVLRTHFRLDIQFT